MRTMTSALICASIALAAGSVAAQDPMKKADPMMPKSPTMQECKDHIAMAKKDGMKKDDAGMKMDKMCADMMKNDSSMKKDTPGDPMKK